jgi:hypothetical protein
VVPEGRPAGEALGAEVACVGSGGCRLQEVLRGRQRLTRCSPLNM